MNEPLLTTNIALALAVGAVGGLIAYRVRLPGGTMIGALILTAAVSLTILPLGPVGRTYQISAQMLVGAAIGCSFEKGMVDRFLRAGGPALLVTVMTIAVGVGGGLALTRFGSIDWISAMLSGAPGGAGEMTAAGMALGGDARLIAGIHFVRQIIVLTLAPVTLRLLLRRKLIVRLLGQE